MAGKGFNGVYSYITGNMLHRLYSSRKEDNIVFSPFSLMVLLAILGDSAAGATKKEIVDIFDGAETFEEMLFVIKQLQCELMSGGALMSSNAVCVQTGILDKMTEGYKERLRGLFNGEIFSSENMIDDVNNWVNEKTRGMIPQIADESMSEMLACIMNAVAFEAKWESGYEYKDIEPGDFHNSDGSINEVDMLFSEENLYVEDNHFKGFVKDYKDVDYSYIALLPKKNNRKYIRKALENLNITKLYESRQNCRVYVRLPEYKFPFEVTLNDYCNELGIKKAFLPGADFSPMSGEMLKVDKMLHKAYILVDRNGTKASAVSAAMLVFSGMGMQIDFKAVELDRPFVFGIVHNKSGLPIFTGFVNQLKQGRKVE